MAHEILHQFGAWDLYREYLEPENARKAMELYPHSVMLNTYSNQDLLEVDEVTAYLIGWHDQFAEHFTRFDRARQDPSKVRGKSKTPSSLTLIIKRRSSTFSQGFRKGFLSLVWCSAIPIKSF